MNLGAACVRRSTAHAASAPALLARRSPERSLVADNFGRLGTAYRETDIERSDLETVITDLISGQFNDPVRVVAFNTLEHWAQDVSRDVALEIQSRCDIDGHDVPEALRDLIDSYAGPGWQLALRLT